MRIILAILSFFTFILLLFLGFTLVFLRDRTLPIHGRTYVKTNLQRGAIPFALMCFTASFVAFTEFMMRWSITEEQAAFWAYLSLPWPLAWAFYFHFILQYVFGLGKSLKRIILFTITYGTALLAIISYSLFLTQVNPIIDAYGYTLHSPNMVSDFPFFFSALWVALLYVLIFLLLARHLFLNQDKEERKRTKYILFALFFSVAFTFTLSAIPVTPEKGLEMNSINYLILVGIIFMGIKRHDIFNIEASSLSNFITDTMDDLFFLTDGNKIVLETNSAASLTLGRPREEIIGKSITELLSVQHHSLEEFAITRRERPVNIPISIRNSRGEKIWIGLTGSPIGTGQDEDGGFVFIARNVTREKEAARKLETAMEERELLIQEIHHRVHNNLQIIVSLLNLKMQEIDTPEVSVLFGECEGRVKAIATAHSILYRSENLSKIDFHEYLTAIRDEILFTHGIPPGISVEIVSGPFPLHIDKAIPAGLIINELVMNSLKHGFRLNEEEQIQTGSITVTVDLQETPEQTDFDDRETKVAISVEDNGIGFPEEFDAESDSALGLQLVLILLSQLNGEYSISSTRTDKKTLTQFRFWFSKES